MRGGWRGQAEPCRRIMVTVTENANTGSENPNKGTDNPNKGSENPSAGSHNPNNNPGSTSSRSDADVSVGETICGHRDSLSTCHR